MSSSSTLKGLSTRWILAARESDLGLWWLADDVGEALGESVSQERVIETTLALLDPMLKRGDLVAGDLQLGGFVPWPGDNDSHIERIRQDWKKLGRAPDIGEVVWLVGRHVLVEPRRE